MQLWQIVLVVGGALVLLWVGGSTLYKRIMISRANTTKGTYTSTVCLTIATGP